MNKERARKITARENRQESLARGGSRGAIAIPSDKRNHTSKDGNIPALMKDDGKEKGRK